MLNAFKAYDIRGRLGVDLDAGIARIAPPPGLVDLYRSAAG